MSVCSNILKFMSSVSLRKIYHICIKPLIWDWTHRHVRCGSILLPRYHLACHHMSPSRIYLKVMKTLQSKALSTMISVVLYSAAFLGMAAFVEQFFGGNWIMDERMLWNSIKWSDLIQAYSSSFSSPSLLYPFHYCPNLSPSVSPTLHEPSVFGVQHVHL